MASLVKWRDGRRQENSVVWVISGWYRWTQRVGDVLWDRRMEQLQNEPQEKLMQNGALKRVLSVSQKILLYTLTAVRTSSPNKHPQKSPLFLKETIHLL